jgi:hypothetical protein
MQHMLGAYALASAALAAVDLPGEVRALDHVHRDGTGNNYRGAALTPGLTPSCQWNARHAAMAREPLCSADRSGLAADV